MTSPNQSGPRTSTRRTAAQRAAALVGVVFLAVGVLGFVPGITTGYDTLQLASHHSEAKLLGLFQVSVLHNLVHLLFGVAGLLLARTLTGAKRYLVVGGALYLVLVVYGLAVPPDSAANIVPLNPADDLLHVVLGLGMLSLGALLTRRPNLEPATDVANQ